MSIQPGENKFVEVIAKSVQDNFILIKKVYEANFTYNFQILIVSIC